MEERLDNLQISEELKQVIRLFYVNTCLSSSVHADKFKDITFIDILERLHDECVCKCGNK